MKELDWYDCYEERWKPGVDIVPEAFAHPAKFAPGLVKRIYRYGMEHGWWKPGDVIGDTFGGVGNGGILAAYEGLRWIGVELESRFCQLGNESFGLHKAAWARGGYPEPVLICGDSRRFAELVQAGGILTSPPYADSLTTPQDIEKETARLKAIGSDHRKIAGQSGTGRNIYGQTSGNIGNLPAGALDASLTSPPYAHIAAGAGGLNTKPAKAGQQGGRNPNSPSQTANQRYGDTPGQIAGLPDGGLDASVTSPPYAETRFDGGKTRDGAIKARPHGTRYGHSAGQIADLPLDGSVTSPPYQNQIVRKRDIGNLTCGLTQGQHAFDAYGQTPGNIGNDAPETYWVAMRTVYEQAHAALKTGGILCVVCKDYIKGGTRVPLCDDTLRLLEAVGFKPVVRIRAWVTKTITEPGLFGDVETVTERKSFFRRLCEKRGSPRIDWEEVLVVRKQEF